MSQDNDPRNYSLKDVYDAAYNNRMNEGLAAEEPKPEPENGQGFGGDVVDSIQYGLAQAGGGLAETGYQLTGIEALADARDASNNWGKSQLEEMSPEGREAMTAQIFEESEPDANGETSLGLGEGATNWKSWALQLSSLAGQMVPQIALGGGFASLGAKVAGKVAMKTAAKKAMAGGASKEASILAGKKAAEATFAAARGTAGVGSYAVVGTAIAGGMIGNEVRDEVMEMTNEQLDQSNEYRKLYYQLSDMQPDLDVDSLRDLTKRTLADRTATTVQKDPMLITSNLLMEAVGGKFLDDIFRGVGSGSRSINAGKQFAVQGSTEAAQGGIEKYASNAAIIDEGVDPYRDAFQGVKGAAANEGILGGALGGVMGAVRKGEPLPQHEPLPANNAEESSNTTEESTQSETVEQPQPTMTLDEAVEQIKAERSEYRGIDDDIAIAQKQGFDEESTRLRAAKRNFEMAQDLMNEGDRDSAMRFRERGLKIYRDVMEPNSPDNHESSNLFPAEYVATGNLMPRENTGVAVANQQQGQTIEAERPADISQQLGSPSERLAHEDIIYGGRDTTEIDEAKAKTDNAFMSQHEPKPVIEAEAESEVVAQEPAIPMLDHDNTIYAPQDTTERDAAKAKTEAAFTQQQGKEPGEFKYDEIQQDKDQAVNRLTEIIADIKKTNVQDVNIKGERGRKGRVKIGDNYQPVTFKLVDMDANPALKPTISRSENQFRDRNRAASDTQISSIAAKLDFNELGESPRMTSGAPTLSREGRVIGGNGRIAAIRKAYAGKAADNYKAELKKRAKEFGISPASIDKMKSPVLIRQFDNPVDIAKTAIESNNSGTMDMSALKQAAADSTLIPNVPDLEVDDSGNINWGNEGNRRSIRGFISALPQSSQNSLLKGDGTISPAGIRRFENLLTYKAFGQNQVLDNLIENAKEESSQNIKNVLQSLAPHIAMVRQGMKRGDYHNIDITDHLVEAIELLESLRASSRSVSDYMAQLDMVSVTDPVTNAIAQELEENVRSPKALREQIKGYYDSIVAAGHPDQSDMFGTKSISLTDLVGLNNGETDTLERDAGQDGLSSKRTPAPKEAQPSNDSGRAEAEPTNGEPDASTEEELLTSYSEEDIATLEAKNKAASDAKAKAELQADQKAKADAEANDFKLSGSDRTADVAAAEGQDSLFDTADKVDQAASESATSKNNDTPEPTKAQQEAGNYKKGHVTIQGLDIAIENERGSERKGTDPDGNEWAVKMAHHYGYIKKTEGADGDHVDVFIGKNPDSEKVFIVDQVNQDGTFDEHKVMLGFDNKAMAVTGYKSSYQKGWKVGPVKSMTMAEFKDWLKSGDTKKPSATDIDDGIKNVVEPENTNETTQKDSAESTSDQEQKPAVTATKDEEQPGSKEPVKKKPVEKLDDAGEVLWGARKHLAAAYEKSFSDEDIESLPLSKIWPKKDIDDIDNHYIAALATVAREQIPSKPRKSYKLSRWVASVQMYRGLVSDVVKNPKLDVLNKSLSDAAGKSQQSANFFNKMQLLSKLDRKDWPRIGSVAINAGAKVVRDGDYVDQPFAFVEIDGVRKVLHGVVDVPSLFPEVKELLSEDVKAKTKKMAFEIRGRAGRFFINKKGDKAYRKLIEFDNLEAASDFRSNQNEKLVELWEAVKAQENVNKADVRPKEALPRTGKDHREGKDITAEEFKDTFGFRGVQFGNWVKQGSGKNDRQGFVNQAYDAFMDLAEIIGIPPAALSLNGELGIAFGARGKSKAMAHFEPGTAVINLTKMSGAGSLAHEWFHAMDNYFHRQKGNASSNNDSDPYLTDDANNYYTKGGRVLPARLIESKGFNKDGWVKVDSGIRGEVLNSFNALVKTLKSSPMQDRSSKVDKGKAGAAYWGTTIEVAARSFENYVVKKMNDAGYSNGFLAQFTSPEHYKLADKTYPYHLPSEMESIEKAFDDVFSVIEVKEEKGKQVLFKLTDNDALASKIKEMRESLRRNEDDPDSTNEINKPATESAFSSVDDVKSWVVETEKFLGKKVNVVANKMDLPIAVKFRVGVANFGKDFDAIYDQETGETWINANQIMDKEHAIKTVLHETLGHGGVIDFLNSQEASGGKEVTDALEDIYRRAGRKLINRDIERYGLDYTDKKQRQTAVLEYIAHLAETGKKANWMHKVIGAIKNAMRKIFPNIAWTDLDTLLLLEKGRRHLRENGNDGQGGESLASLAKSEAEEFRTNLGRTLKSKRTRVGSIVVSKTPEILKQLGVPDNNITIERDIVRKATNGIKHDVSLETIEYLPELLADPVMVFDSKKAGSIVVVVDAKDESGRSVMTALQIDSLDKGIKVNRIGSVYGRESNEHYSKWIEEGLLRYIDKDKSSDLVRYEGLQLPRNGSLDQNSSTRVLTKADIVNSSNDALMRLSNTGEVDDAPSNQAKAAPKKGFETLAEDGTDYKSRASHIIRVMADKFKPLKDIQENIKKAGVEISESADAYLAEELFHGKAENDIRTLRETYIEPLANKMAAFGITHAKLDEYLYAKHAPERNEQIAKINPDLPDGGSGMTTELANSIVKEIESSSKAGQYEQLSNIIYSMLSAQREALIDGGLMDGDVIDSWSDSYKYYVPLKGLANDEKAAGFSNTGKGFNISGKESKRALGRKTKAESPISHAIKDTTEKLIRKRKNEVGNAFLNLVEQNPNKEFWQIFTDENPDTSRSVTKSKDPKTGEVVETVKETAIPMAMLKDQYFVTKRKGKSYYIKVSDPRLMKAMKNIGPEASNPILRTLAGVNRYLSAINTSYSPEFTISNFARDIQTALLNLNAEQSRDDGKIKGEGIVKQTLKDVPKAMNAVYRSLRGKSAKNKEWAEWFDEFREAGAKTGYFDMKDIDGQSKELEVLTSIAEGGFKGGFYKWTKATAKLVEDANQSIENAVRLSAYANARKAGISKAKAASLAKNMTVNFNRRGEAGTTLNSLYMFANASIQGTLNFARTMGGFKGEKGDPIWSRLNSAQKISVGIMAGAYTLALMNRMGAGEDDDGENYWDKVPSYIKERNIVIMKSLLGGDQDGTYWKIPAPYGYNIFNILGTSAESVAAGNSVGQAASDVTLGFLGSFSPIGFSESDSVTGTILKNAMPTIGKPFLDVGMNENFFGGTIYSENFPFGTPKPDSSLGRLSTPEGYKAIASFMNEVTGGSEYRAGLVDVNPDVMRYFISYLTGGAGNFAFNKLPDTAYRLTNDLDIESNKVPFLSKVNGKVTPYQDRSEFYDRRDEIGQIMEEYQSLNGDEKQEFRKEYGSKIRLKGMVKGIEKSLSSLRKQRTRILSQDLSPADEEAKLKLIDERIKKLIDRFNKAYGRA